MITRTKYTLIFVVGMLIGFFGGLYWEYKAEQYRLDEIEQIAQEACDMRIKTIKYTCKR